MMNPTLYSTIITSLVDLNDLQGGQILSIIAGMKGQQNNVKPVVKAPTTQAEALSKVSLEDEDTFKPTVIEGTKLWEEDFCTVSRVDKQYRLYITCPIGGEKGSKIRYAIKAGAKQDFGAKFGGDFKAGKIFWVFPDKKTAEAYIKSRKEYANTKKA